MNLHDYFLQLARYHAWATHELLHQNLARLSDEQWHRSAGLFFGSVHGTVNHLIVTDDTWHARFALGTSPRIALDAQPHADRGAASAALAQIVERWHAWIEGASFDAARLASGELAYTRHNGELVRVPFAPTLGHVFNHATHHRGQLSAAVSAMGHPAPVLDWVYLLQQQQQQQQREPQEPLSEPRHPASGPTSRADVSVGPRPPAARS